MAARGCKGLQRVAKGCKESLPVDEMRAPQPGLRDLDETRRPQNHSRTFKLIAFTFVTRHPANNAHSQTRE